MQKPKKCQLSLSTLPVMPRSVSGLIIGLLGNAFLWISAPEISWLWWNVFGFFIAFAVGFVVSLATGGSKKELAGLVWYPGVSGEFNYEVNWPRRFMIMIAYSIAMIAFCASLASWL